MLIVSMRMEISHVEFAILDFLEMMVIVPPHRVVSQYITLDYIFEKSKFAACSDGNIRLMNGSVNTTSFGRVEVCYNNSYGSVCNDRWDVRDASVVCRQLNLEFSSKMFDGKVYFLFLVSKSSHRCCTNTCW